MGRRGYHHGDLRRALLAAATEAIRRGGPNAVSLRELARQTGVSHAAPQHHFGDKAGLLTALALEGYERLAEALEEADGDLLAAGVAYVRFAVDYPAHFQVMFQPGLYHRDDPQVAAAARRTWTALETGLRNLPRPPEDRPAAAVAAWSIVHGFATLWLAGGLPPELGDDPAAAAPRVIRRLFED
jgi:AcrR family transcriptional regulator